MAEVDPKAHLSRITVVTSGTPMIIEQIKAQLGRLVPVHNVRDLMRDVQANIAAADIRFRETHAGLPVDVIVADFREHGPSLELSEETLHAYALAVSTGEPFEWRLIA